MSDRSATLKAKLRAGDATVGGWLTLPDLSVAEILSGTGFDWLLIDTEHGAFDLGTVHAALAAFRGCSTVPIVGWRRTMACGSNRFSIWAPMA